MRLKLLGKMLLYIMGPSVVGLALLAVVAGYIASESMTESADKQLSELARVQAEEINALIWYMEDVATSVTRQTEMSYLANLSNLNRLFPGDFFQNQVNIKLAEVTKDYRDISSTFLVDLKGVIVGHTNPDRNGRDLGNYQCVVESINTGKVATEVRFSAQTNAFSAFIAAPVFDEDGKIAGALVLMLDLAALATHSVGALDLSDTANASVYTLDGTIIMDASDNIDIPNKH